MAKMNVSTHTVPMAGTSSGSVILKNACRLVAPSTRAASVSSSGTPAERGAVEQAPGSRSTASTLTRMTTQIAVFGSPSHGRAHDSSPTASSAAC